MTDKRRSRLSLIAIVLGGILILSALAVILYISISAQYYSEKIPYYVEQLYDIIPEPVSAVPQSRINNTMPAVSVEDNIIRCKSLS